jgi:hypothetical protein
LTTTHELLQAQSDETNGNTEFLQPYSFVVTDGLLGIGAVVFSDVYRSMSIVTEKHFLHTIST